MVDSVDFYVNDILILNRKLVIYALDDYIYSSRHKQISLDFLYNVRAKTKDGHTLNLGRLMRAIVERVKRENGDYVLDCKYESCDALANFKIKMSRAGFIYYDTLPVFSEDIDF